MEGKGKEKGRKREGESKYLNFCSFGSFQNGFEKPKQTERSDNILSEKIPKQNRNCQCFGLFRFEPKEKIRFAGHPSRVRRSFQFEAKLSETEAKFFTLRSETEEFVSLA
jgi:hypothetical protein